jgi:hypothetical protein
LLADSGFAAYFQAIERDVAKESMKWNEGKENQG